ncbi:amino acid/amide ABC transporter ATP-binding protein 1 (HAAT family) [Rhodopseudomonas thermotolerans]|uniref:Amino acid/amide ABC transporter ATP-binding protein 1 (HAAT family) n=2 Tax=Rhodopseudomonas TaxID=1073 RepID=A0A336JT17_9BRAD|nr:MULTISPECIES: ABC transporter ATP-binding protein [Rhodopseudomonas]RED36174.1 amino acid/amide ABC transporter ATP-binding protein 1 (HAAT family) [Rhodopseudomonas pentothenatexigens]REG03546.1 amino acid/amide ABC transporter ATP-binding protein 1 (HAAT family) [Rhodopseudomonas thermotolerans]SSW90734.1 amino acid/amide ABC transporter ATP-binding protein 1 (HAAT family) [Rhodopseudomonas pentothenatexigens]
MSELLRLTGVSRRFSGLQALRDVNLSVARGEVLGLIGPNGAGKTTLVNTICGVTPANTGSVVFDGKDITRIKTYQAARLGLSRTFQIVQPFAEFSALDNVAAAALFSQPGASLKSAREAAREHLAFVGLEAQAEQPAATLTLAMRKRLELAKALAMEPKLLFLDEVNAGLNSAEVERATKLIHQLAAGGITIVMIEHLMKVVLNVCTRIVVLHNGHPIADGPPREVISNPAVVEAYLGQQYAQRAARHG